MFNWVGGWLKIFMGSSGMLVIDRKVWASMLQSVSLKYASYSAFLMHVSYGAYLICVTYGVSLKFLNEGAWVGHI